MVKQRNMALACLFLVASGGSHLPASEGETGGDGESKQELTRREPTKFMRVLRDEFQVPVALQTATAKYVLKDSHGDVRLDVRLEGVIHIADRAYYEAFNQRFAHYDTVLYELVAPPEHRIPDASRSQGNPLALLQQLAAEGLGLSHQVETIDYRRENLVHSDLSPAEMARAMRDRGDDPFTMLLDTMQHFLNTANQKATSPGGAELALDLSVLADPDGTVKLRRMLAEAFDETSDLEKALPPKQRTMLIDDRNDRAMEVFQRQLDAGHRRIALFWGVGHMSDFEKRLILDYGLQPDGVIWRNAWDLRAGSVGKSPLESLLDKTLRGALQEAARGLAPRP